MCTQAKVRGYINIFVTFYLRSKQGSTENTQQSIDYTMKCLKSIAA